MSELEDAQKEFDTLRARFDDVLVVVNKARADANYLATDLIPRAEARLIRAKQKAAADALKREAMTIGAADVAEIPAEILGKP